MNGKKKEKKNRKKNNKMNNYQKSHWNNAQVALSPLTKLPPVNLLLKNYTGKTTEKKNVAVIRAQRWDISHAKTST
jgi:hypothetical protein